MGKRIRGLFHPALTLACLGCCGYLLWKDRRQPERWLTPEQGGAGRMSLDMDRVHRVFHQVRWLGGDYELPTGEDHCGVALLRFEDGKFCGRMNPSVWSVPPGGPRAVRYMVMWGPSGPGTRYITYSDGGFVTNSGHENDPFFADLNGGIGRTFGPTHDGEVRGYRIIGHAASRAFRADLDKEYGDISGGFDVALKLRKRVIVMGVKPFVTREEAEKWMLGDPEPAER